MSSADSDISIVAADLNLFAVSDRSAFGVDSQDHDRFATAVADGFDFRQIIGPGQQVLATFEEVSLEIRAKAVRQYGDRESIGDITELADLGFGQKLSFVDQHAVDDRCVVFALGDAKEVIARFEGDRVGGKSDAGANFGFSEPIVDFGSEDEGSHAPFAVVVARLQQDGGFACVHRRVVKVQFSHGIGSFERADLWEKGIPKDLYEKAKS